MKIAGNRRNFGVDLVINYQKPEMGNLNIYSKFETLPKALKEQVADFIDFLLQKSRKKSEKSVATFGSAKGKIKLSPDFDEPIDDFKDYM